MVVANCKPNNTTSQKKSPKNMKSTIFTFFFLTCWPPWMAVCSACFAMSLSFCTLLLSSYLNCDRLGFFFFFQRIFQRSAACNSPLAQCFVTAWQMFDDCLTGCSCCFSCQATASVSLAQPLEWSECVKSFECFVLNSICGGRGLSLTDGVQECFFFYFLTKQKKHELVVLLHCLVSKQTQFPHFYDVMGPAGLYPLSTIAHGSFY